CARHRQSHDWRHGSVWTSVRLLEDLHAGLLPGFEPALGHRLSRGRLPLRRGHGLLLLPNRHGVCKLAYDTYRFSLGINRFRQAGSGYSRIVQCAEALSRARDVLANTYTNAAWQDDLLNKSESMIQSSSADQDFAHLLDANWSGYPQTKTVVDDQGNPVDMPVAPFQYLESHDHSQLIVFT